MLEVFFPPSCVGCDEVLSAPGYFCSACAPLVLDISVRCRRCGEPGGFPRETCPRCEARPPDFDAAFAPFEHDGALATAIHRYKYEDHPELARPLGELLARDAQEFLKSAPGAICPVPLHTRRFRERKFDQATLLATQVAKRVGRPLRDGWLTRVRETKQQVGLDDAGREANVRDAFAADSAVRGEDVVLVDDVLTTGATVREAARALKGCGAARVWVLTLARARRQLL